LVETIKSEVAQRDWALREWATLRRLKLEELLAKNADGDDFLDRLRDRTLEGEQLTDRRPDAEMETLMTLYFPELRDEVKDYSRCFSQQVLIGREATFAIMQSIKAVPFDRAKHQAIQDKYINDLKPLWDETSTANKQLKAAAARLVQGIMGIA